MMVTMSMEEYKSLDGKAEKLKSIRRLAKDIIAEHGKETDWPKWSDLKETMTLDEAHLLLKKILED